MSQHFGAVRQDYILRYLYDNVTMAKLTTQDFIDRARKVHGDRYDYSQVKYVNARTKVKIACSMHGVFEQLPSSHSGKKGRGCRRCGMESTIASNRKNNSRIAAEAGERFAEKARLVHGNRYDYSQVEYVNNHSKITIICSKHGKYSQVPSSHLAGNGCPECAGTKRQNTETFIARSVKKHGDRYNYSDVNYVNRNTNVPITCREHGVFSQAPFTHLSGAGCPDCGGSKPLNTDKFIAKARSVHGDKYIYSKSEYVNAKTDVEITCPEHGAFHQSANPHLAGKGCLDCSGVKLLTQEDFIARSREVWGDIYDYSKAVYVNNRNKVVIICPHHGAFEQSADSHWRGSGCSKCADSGFDPSKSAIMYYLRVETHNQLAYKIGITNRTVEDRFQVTDLEKITTVKEFYYDSGQDALDREQEILKEYAKYQYVGEPMLETGNWKYGTLQSRCPETGHINYYVLSLGIFQAKSHVYRGPYGFKLPTGRIGERGFRLFLTPMCLHTDFHSC